MPSLSKFCGFKNILKLNVNRLRYFHSFNSNRLDPNTRYVLRNVQHFKYNYQPIRGVYSEGQLLRARTWFYYFLSLTIVIAGLGFAAVPLFNAYCQVNSIVEPFVSMCFVLCTVTQYNFKYSCPGE